MPSKTRELFEPDTGWRAEAECAKPENKRLFFSEKDIWFHLDADDPEYDEEVDGEEAQGLNEDIAKGICFQCPVRDLCLREALESPHLDGTRGGLSETEIRRTLSVDETGKEIRRGEFPSCPYCFADTEALIPTKIDLPDGGRWSEAKAVKCGSCGFEWKARSSHNAVVAYQNEKRKRAEQERREQIARERMSK